jgi:hypothetical protein
MDVITRYDDSMVVNYATMTPWWLITQDLTIVVRDSQQSALVLKNVIASDLTIKQQLANGDYKVKANV